MLASSAIGKTKIISSRFKFIDRNFSGFQIKNYNGCLFERLVLVNTQAEKLLQALPIITFGYQAVYAGKQHILNTFLQSKVSY
jgi:hypothetical protein